MSENSNISYESFWGDSERKDLLPPRDVTVERQDFGGNTPIDVDVDRMKLKELLMTEGVRDGMPVHIVFRDNKGSFRRGQEMGRDKAGVIHKRQRDIADGLRLGRCQTRNGEITISINIGTIYESALGMFPTDRDQVLEKFINLTATVVSHEAGHARQPRGIRAGGNTQTYIKVVGGLFTLIDAGRRTALPWLGPAEVLAVPAELAAAEAAGRKLYYERIPGEKFANEYSESAATQWRDVLQVRLKDERQMQQDIDEKNLLKKMSVK